MNDLNARALDLLTDDLIARLKRDEVEARKELRDLLAAAMRPTLNVPHSGSPFAVPCAPAPYTSTIVPQPDTYSPHRIPTVCLSPTINGAGGRLQSGFVDRIGGS